MIVLLALAGGIVVYAVDPSGAWWMPKCPFHAITGLDCPSCGTTRALHHILHGRLSAGLACNPMAPVLWILAMAIIVICLRYPERLPSTLLRVLVAVYILVYIGWGIVRNV